MIEKIGDLTLELKAKDNKIYSISNGTGYTEQYLYFAKQYILEFRFYNDEKKLKDFVNELNDFTSDISEINIYREGRKDPIFTSDSEKYFYKLYTDNSGSYYLQYVDQPQYDPSLYPSQF